MTARLTSAFRCRATAICPRSSETLEQIVKGGSEKWREQPERQEEEVNPLCIGPRVADSGRIRKRLQKHRLERPTVASEHDDQELQSIIDIRSVSPPATVGTNYLYALSPDTATSDLPSTRCSSLVAPELKLPFHPETRSGNTIKESIGPATSTVNKVASKKLGPTWAVSTPPQTHQHLPIADENFENGRDDDVMSTAGSRVDELVSTTDENEARSESSSRSESCRLSIPVENPFDQLSQLVKTSQTRLETPQGAADQRCQSGHADGGAKEGGSGNLIAQENGLENGLECSGPHTHSPVQLGPAFEPFINATPPATLTSPDPPSPAQHNLISPSRSTTYVEHSLQSPPNSPSFRREGHCCHCQGEVIRLLSQILKVDQHECACRVEAPPAGITEMLNGKHGA